MVSVTSASRYITSVSRYHPRYQSRSSMYFRGLIPRNIAELAKAVPVAHEILVAYDEYVHIRRLVFALAVRKNKVWMLMNTKRQT